MDGLSGAALVLLSGGLDSAVCLYQAKKKFDSVYAITFDYFRRLERERQAAEQLAAAVGVKKLFHVSLPFLRETSDYDGFTAERDPLGKDSGLASYIPARNMIFYSIAAYYAEYLGIDTIIGGHNQHDPTFFRDSSPSYFDKINALYEQGCVLCSGKPYKVFLPLREMNRRMIIELARDLQVPIELTWSCHCDGKAPCGQCYACVQRAEAFSSLQLKDPLLRA